MREYDRRVIIGLVGQPLAGKDTVAAYLVERHGFSHVSTSDLLRFYIAEHGLGEPNRPLMQDVGNRLRAEKGDDYLVQLALVHPSERLIVSGLRHPDEAEAIQAGGGILVAVTAPQEVRYQRALGRGRTGDQISFAQFQAEEARDNQSAGTHAQQVGAVVALADYSIENAESLESMQTAVEQLLEVAF